MRFCVDICGLQCTNPTDFSSGATVSLTFVVLSEISQQILDGLP